LAAIDAQEQAFAIDALKLKTEAAALTAKSARSAFDRENLLEQINAVLVPVLAADRYDLARSLADTALATARAANDAELVRQANVTAAQIRDIEYAFADVKKFLQILADQPTDPTANFKVGKFRCFLQGDWDRGLPLLAQGSDPMLKALAIQDRAGAAEFAAQVKLGNAWWDASDKDSGTAKLSYQKRAVLWYNQALPNLTGPAKSQVESRLKIFASLTTVRAVNVLKLVNLKRDAIAGTWELQNGALVSDDTNYARLEIWYQPPAEYDYKVVFTRTAGMDSVVVFCTAQDRQFLLLMGLFGNTTFGFEAIDGAGVAQNKTCRKAKAWLVTGQKHTALIKVRKDGVRAYLDGKLITEHKTDYRDLALFGQWRLHRKDTLGLGSINSPTMFHSAEIIEVTGHGKFIK
ncbi:MAG: hypothetical protein WCI73_12545, partial [Phycisphaerae bacterium]